MFKEGDEIICIDDSFDSSVLNFGQDSLLTYGKSYRVVDRFPLCGGIRIQDNKGQFNSFLTDRFVSKETFRKIKIDRICSKLVT